MLTKRLTYVATALILGIVVGASLANLIFFNSNDPYLDQSMVNVDGGTVVPAATSTPTTTDAVTDASGVPQTPDTPVSSDDDAVMCTMDAKLCPDGVTYVGRVAPSCAFAPCPDAKPVPQKEIVCTPEQKASDVCIEIYAPVCASVQVECVTTPCDPVKQTYPNSCYACREDRVISYTEGGACPGDVTAE